MSPRRHQGRPRPPPALGRRPLPRRRGEGEGGSDGEEAEEKSEAIRKMLHEQFQDLDEFLTPDEVEVSDDVIASIIRGHTREAGVRALERVEALAQRAEGRQDVGVTRLLIPFADRRHRAHAHGHEGFPVGKGDCAWVTLPLLPQ